MTHDEKLLTFQDELHQIHDELIKDLVETAFYTVSEEFFSAPASSSGKYHPLYALGEGGLVRHTKVAVMFATELMNLQHSEFTELEKDLVVAALILHDSCKGGIGKWGKTTKTEHPDLVENLLSQEDFQEYPEPDKAHEYWLRICRLVASHMGQWSKSKYPQSRLQKFVHECDYLASRKHIEVTAFGEGVRERVEAEPKWRQDPVTSGQVGALRKAMANPAEKDLDCMKDVPEKLEAGTLKKGEASDIISTLRRGK